MANRLYDKGRQGFLEGTIAWLSDDLAAVLVDTDAYTPNFVTDEFLSDIPLLARISTSGLLTGKTSDAGIADADDATFSLVTGNESEAVVIIKDTGVEGTSQLVAYIDTATGLPVTPNGGDIVVVWDDGANKIFKL